jgi:GTPase
MKSAWITIIGRPSSGKSTILNRLCGKHVSITAPSPQTTRNTIRGILTEEQGQLVFADTPGYHISEKKLNRYLKENAESALDEADLILYVCDASRPDGEEEEAVRTLIRPVASKVITAINKMDLPKADPEPLSRAAGIAFPERPLITLSAETGKGLEQLKSALFAAAPEGEMLYPEEFYTDQDPEFRVTEIIRGAVVNRVRQELPHAIYVAVEDMEIRNLMDRAPKGGGESSIDRRDERDDVENQELWIRAVIYTERESQKGMIVGKGGSGIAAIGKVARSQLKKLFPQRINLDLRVKCDPKWRNREHLLKRLTGGWE